MAISATHLTAGNNGGGSITGITASVSPGANRLVLIAVGVYGSTTTPATISATGNGITYAQVAASSAFDDGFGPKRIYLLRGMSASPSAGAITITTTGLASFPYVGWVVTEVAGVDTGGTNGSAAVVQSGNNTVNGGTSVTVTLSAFSSVNNGAYCCAYNYGGSSYAPDTGWSELFDGASNDEPSTQWIATNDTTAVWTFGAPDDAGSIAIEIAAAGGGGDVTLPLTGSAATYSAGSLATSRTVALSGSAGTYSAGTIAPARSIALTGSSAAYAAGTLTPSISIALTGEAAAFAAGTITIAGGGDVTLALTGSAATFSTGALTPSTTLALVGSSTAFTAGNLAPSLSLSLSGQATTYAVGSMTPSTSIALLGAGIATATGIVTPSGGTPVIPSDSQTVGFIVNVGSLMVRK